MAGVTVSGVLWAIFQNNAGGAWDNAKKSFEAGVEINGEMTYKGSDAHKAAVTGDTVGDPFKDTSGPSMNILIKLTCLIGLVIAPILGGHTDEGDTAFAKAEKAIFITEGGEKIELNIQTDKATKEVEKQVEIKMTSGDDENAKAVITATTTENGEITVDEKVIEGTADEVKAKIEAIKDVEVKIKEDNKKVEMEVSDS